MVWLIFIIDIEKNLAFRAGDKKMQFLLEILPPSALGILPYTYIINAIKSLLIKKLDQDDQRFLVRLVLSITAAHANDFLDFLLEKENGEQTNFETIYESLTDARLERYTFVNWFVDEQTNKKYFAFALFELWKVSKYNLNYIRPGVVVPDPFPNFKGVDPGNYFYIHPNEFNKKNFLDFNSSYNVSNHKISLLSFQSSIEDKKIKIDKLIRDEHEVDIRNTHDDKPVFFGAFHLYQQVSFSGFEANLDLSIPKSATVPAFLFHFIEEFDRLADFDAGVSLAIDLTANVLLAYFSGGASVLRDLEYLKYTTQIGKALTGGIEATQAIEIWRGLEVGGEVFTLTAGSLEQINTYLITTENNEAKKKIFEGYRKVLIPLIFLGAGISAAARAHAVREAQKVLDLIDILPSGVAHGLSQDAINLLTTLKGDKTVTLTLFGNRLNTLDLGGATNTIISKFNTYFTDAQKLAFWKDFQQIDDPEFWKLLNSGKNASNVLDGSYMLNWQKLTERGLVEAKFTDYICVQKRTDALIRYYDVEELKVILETLEYNKRLKFLDDFGSISQLNNVRFNKLVQQPNKMELLLELQTSIKRGHLDFLDTNDVLKIIDSDLSEITIDFLRIKNKYILKQLINSFRTEIININIDINRLRSLFEGNADEFAFFQGLSSRAKKKFIGRNKLLIKIKPYQNNIPGNEIFENYISGNKEMVESIFGTNLPNGFIEPSSYSKFDDFISRKAFDIDDVERFGDTEVKFIFNFLENHWNKGNKFTIEMESTLYTCSSCQGYLLYLKKLAKDNDKILEITFIANQDAKNYSTLVETLYP